METAILLAVAASVYTAVCWVCQRIGATSSPATGLDAGPAAAARTASVPAGQRRADRGRQRACQTAAREEIAP
jgi:hypothetical protein